MRRWLSAVFAAVMLLSVSGVVQASGEGPGATSCTPGHTTCAMDDSDGGRCACCRPSPMALQDACGMSAPQCGTSAGFGLHLDLINPQRGVEAGTTAAPGASESQPWPTALALLDSSGRQVEALLAPHGSCAAGPPLPLGSRERLARIGVLRI